MRIIEVSEMANHILNKMNMEPCFIEDDNLFIRDRCIHASSDIEEISDVYLLKIESAIINIQIGTLAKALDTERDSIIAKALNLDD